MSMDDITVAMEPYYAKLAALSTAEEIRDFLAAEGVRGWRRSHLACPIAAYISKGSGEPVNVDKSTIGPATCLSHRPFVHTSAMALFIMRFDYGAYPELDIDS